MPVVFDIVLRERFIYEICTAPEKSPSDCQGAVRLRECYFVHEGRRERAQETTVTSFWIKGASNTGPPLSLKSRSIKNLFLPLSHSLHTSRNPLYPAILSFLYPNSLLLSFPKLFHSVPFFYSRPLHFAFPPNLGRRTHFTSDLRFPVAPFPFSLPNSTSSEEERTGERRIYILGGPEKEREIEKIERERRRGRRCNGEIVPPEGRIEDPK